MITADKTKDQAAFYGLSTDDKPTGGAVANGSAFLEMDTGKLYFYNASGAAWIEWGASA